MQWALLIVCGAVVAWLVERHRTSGQKVSSALWIPLFWILIIASRSPSGWLGMNSGISQIERYSEGTPVDAAIFGALILSGLMVLNARARGVAAFFSSNMALLSFFAWCAVSVAWSADPVVAAKHWVKAVGDLVMALVVLTDRFPLVAVRKVYTWSALLLLGGSLLMIYAYPSMGSNYEPDTHLRTWCGVTTQKNELGVDCLVFGLTAIWVLTGIVAEENAKHKKGGIVIQILIPGMAVFLLIRCNSMTSLSCMLLSSVLLILVNTKVVRVSAYFVSLLMLSTLSVAIFAVFMDNTGLLLQLLGRNSSLTGRTEIWQAVLAVENNPWIGSGYDSFWLGSHIRMVAKAIGYTGVTEAHNGYLEVFINLGWAGVLLLTWVLISAWHRAVQRLSVSLQEGCWAVALVVANLIFNLSESGVKKQSLIWLAFLMATVEIPLASLRSEQRTKEEWKSFGSVPAAGMRILH